MSGPIDDVIIVMEEVRRFVECDFTLEMEGDDSGMSRPRKQALAKWQRFYHSKINRPRQIVSHLLLLMEKCEASEADSLKTLESHLVHQVVKCKSRFDSSFESLLNELNSLTCDVLVSALGNNTHKEDCVRLEKYWTALQLEVADKIKSLIIFQDGPNARYSVS